MDYASTLGHSPEAFAAWYWASMSNTIAPRSAGVAALQPCTFGAAVPGGWAGGVRGGHWGDSAQG